MSFQISYHPLDVDKLESEEYCKFKCPLCEFQVRYFYETHELVVDSSGDGDFRHYSAYVLFIPDKDNYTPNGVDSVKSDIYDMPAETVAEIEKVMRRAGADEL